MAYREDDMVPGVDYCGYCKCSYVLGVCRCDGHGDQDEQTERRWFSAIRQRDQSRAGHLAPPAAGA